MNPGTVSKILWHFTGGPSWDKGLKKQKKNPKSINEAYEILIKIINTSQLKISDYSELVKVTIPEVNYFNRKTRTREKKFLVERIIESSPVCCLADIPIQHLDFHSERYGKVAIGFHRESAIASDFNPVLYSLHDSPVINSIYAGFSAIESVNTDDITYELDSIDGFLNNIQIDLDRLEEDTDHIDTDGQWLKWDIERRVEDIEREIDDTKVSIRNLVSFVKSFTIEEFSSIYCEREWRALNRFDFTHSDIAMIVLPQKGGYYDDLISSKKLPDYIPIVPWEDLIEH